MEMVRSGLRRTDHGRLGTRTGPAAGPSAAEIRTTACADNGFGFDKWTRSPPQSTPLGSEQNAPNPVLDGASRLFRSTVPRRRTLLVVDSAARRAGYARSPNPQTEAFPPSEQGIEQPRNLARMKSPNHRHRVAPNPAVRRLAGAFLLANLLACEPADRTASRAAEGDAVAQFELGERFAGPEEIILHTPWPGRAGGGDE